MSDVDRLEVSIEAQATNANNALDKLITQLNSVGNSLSYVNTSGLNGLTNGVQKFAQASANLSNVKTSDFTKLSKNISTLSNLNTSQIYAASSAITTIGKSLNSIGSVSDDAMKIAELAKGISKLGNKGVTNAITNMPKLASSLNSLMTTLSKTPKVSDNLIKMTNSLATLSSQGSKVGSTSKSISSSLKSYSSSANSATKASFSLSSAIGKLYQSYFIVFRGIKQLGAAITSSMDYIEEYNYFNVTMGKIGSEWSKDYSKYGYNSAESYANSFKDRMNQLTSKMTGFNVQSDGTLIDSGMVNLGLDVTGLMNYETSLSQITNSLGLIGEASMATSQALSMLAGDMSSFRNTELSTVMTNFQSGLIGQSRALYKYGIDITNATLQTYAYKYGLSQAVSEMTQADKMQLRTLAILEQSKASWGDLANTINSPSNQLRLLKDNFKSLGRTIGNIFMPMVAKVLPYINGLVIAIRRLFEWCGKMLGVDLKGIIGDSGAGYSDAFEDVADDTEDMSDGLDDATSSAKELKNELVGFD